MSTRTGEKAETFIRALYELSEHYEFCNSRDENICDRIVIGILDKKLSRKFQLTKDLTLTLTVEKVRQFEEVAKQVSMQEEAADALTGAANTRAASESPKGGNKGQWKV